MQKIAYTLVAAAMFLGFANIAEAKWLSFAAAVYTDNSHSDSYGAFGSGNTLQQARMMAVAQCQIKSKQRGYSPSLCNFTASWHSGCVYVLSGGGSTAAGQAYSTFGFGNTEADAKRTLMVKLSRLGVTSNVGATHVVHLCI